jgi:long-chain fatty acid transport protein
MKRKSIITALVLASASLIATSSSATDGYFQHGYGLISKGMGGASTATASDTFGGASNPAKMVFVGDRLDIGIDFFSPQRSASRSGSSAALNIDGSANSDSTLFEIPEFGYNKLINPRLALGVSVYGNGGMNTDYPGGQISTASACQGFNPGAEPYNLLCGNGRLGVDLSQLVIAPTVSYKFSEGQAIGIAPLFGYQRFKADGLQAFASPAFSNSPSNVTNQGYDTAHGYGARIGWFGKFSDVLAVGAAYSTKISMSKFDMYKGLFAEEGGFDMPENYNAGMALKVSPTVSIVADYQRINYSKVKSVGNPSSLLGNCFFGGDRSACLGGSNGAGFGWQDINVWKLGVEYRHSDHLTLRGGYNHSDNPIQAKDVTINILAPGVIQDHLTLGATYLTQSGGELTFAYMHAFTNSVTGSSFFNAFAPPGTTAGSETIKMYENAFGIAYGWKM